MSVTRSTLRFGCGLAALAFTAVLVCTAEAGSRQQGRSIEFSQPKSFEVMTNLQQLATKKDSLKQLEEDLYQPLQTFTPKSSLEGVVAPLPRAPAPSAIQSKRAKELLERRRDWVFMTPEDLLAAPTVEQILKTPEYGPDGYPKKDLPAMERYYQSMVPKRSTRGKLAQPKDDEWFNLAKEPAKPGVAPARDDVNLPDELKASAEALRYSFETGRGDSPFGGGATPGGFSDPFRVASKAPSQEHLLEHKKLMDEYRTIVDPSWRPPVAARPAAPAFNFADPAQAPQRTPTGLPGAASPTLRKGPDALPDPANPVLGPPPMPDVNAQALGQTKSAAAAGKVQPRRVIPPAPDFTAPKRAF